jgi:hypothetical protein
MSDFSPGVTGAKRTRWSEDNPDAVLAEIYKSDTTANDKQLINRMMQEVEGDRALLRVVVAYYVYNRIKAIKKALADADEILRGGGRGGQKYGGGQPRGGDPEIKEKAEAAIRDRLRELAEELYALPMPNGKDLGDCTGRDLDRMNSASVRLRKLVPANMTVREAVGSKKLTETQLEMLAKSYQ